MEREPGINNPYPLPSKRDIAITAIDAAIAEAVKEWKQDAEKYRRVIASRVERELSKDEMIAQMLASGKAMNCTPEVSARCNAANAELDAAYIMLADDAKAALAAAIRARGNQ